MAKQESAADICRRRTLQTRIRAMAKRWDYAKDEYENAIELAKADPDAWERLCDHDEALTAKAAGVAAVYGPAINYGDRPTPEPGKTWWDRDSEPTNT